MYLINNSKSKHFFRLLIILFDISLHLDNYAIYERIKINIHSNGNTMLSGIAKSKKNNSRG